MAAFYTCEHCANLLVSLKDGSAPTCCGDAMKVVEPNTVDAAAEKHVPVVAIERDGHIIHVTVGETAHPMEEEHYIELIALETPERFEVHRLKPGQTPTTFFPGNVEHGAVYALCNLHGLWKAEF